MLQFNPLGQSVIVTRNRKKPMNRHQLTYIDLHPAPVKPEPSGFAIWCGAAVFMLGVCALIALAFSL